MDRKLAVFDWNVMEDTDRYGHCDRIINRVCGMPDDDVYLIQSIMDRHPGLKYIRRKPDFIRKLDEIIGDIPMLRLPTEPDVTALTDDHPDNEKASYLYAVYQCVYATIHTDKEMTGLLTGLALKGIDTALISDTAVWDTKRQDAADIPSFRFKWRSYQMGKCVKSPDGLIECMSTIQRAGYETENVILVSKDNDLLHMTSDVFGWKPVMYGLAKAYLSQK